MVKANKVKKQPIQYGHSSNQSRNKQRGVVLVVSLVFLVALTAVASALMLNTTTDMKMSGASEAKVVANQEAFAATDELIFRQVRPAAGGRNDFALPIITFANGNRDVLVDLVQSNTQNDVTSATIGLANNEFVLESDCPHSRSASSTQVFTCNMLRVQIIKVYGRKQNSTIQVNSGIAQQLLR
ncbi:PilX N-terminal domain-containing pilus assembly protein [Colwellia sp. Bg11-28]|uniref:PilX N-terminal domain-containing pilus assembly protein n=1 Tax=Colwellia sp. Bg11-28 TaxID=2058305 RepID=UPI001E416A79|nr:PilX N-terminal domain-containing pilus assembly protein [Colwellia sp. Bg11-28]